MHRDFFQVIDHDAADDPSNQRPEEPGAEAISDPGANRTRCQRGALGDGVTNIGRQERHHQGQPRHADIKQLFEVWIGRRIRHGTFAVQHDGNRQQDPTRYHKGDHVRHAGHQMLTGVFQDLHQLFHKSLPGQCVPISIKMLWQQ